MSSKLGEVFVAIVGKDMGLKAALDKANREADSAAKDINTSIRSIGTNMATTISSALAAAGVGMAIKGSIEKAMDAVESENLFGESMGRLEGDARKWSQGISKALGLNEYAIRKNIGTFYVMLDSMGAGEKASYDMAKGLTQLSYDMASFYNLRPDEAFGKLQAGISGETEPLKRLGIVISETAVKAYALKTGLAKQGQEMTEAQKIAARYGLIMERTAKAQGDMARTLDAPANQVRRLREQFDMLTVKIGIAFLPLIQSLVPVVSRFAEFLAKIPGPILAFGMLMGLAVASAGPLITVIKSLGHAYQFLAEKQAAQILIQAVSTNNYAKIAALVGGLVAGGGILYLFHKGLNSITEDQEQFAKSGIAAAKGIGGQMAALRESGEALRNSGEAIRDNAKPTIKSEEEHRAALEAKARQLFEVVRATREAREEEQERRRAAIGWVAADEVWKKAAVMGERERYYQRPQGGMFSPWQVSGVGISQYQEAASSQIPDDEIRRALLKMTSEQVQTNRYLRHVAGFLDPSGYTLFEGA